MTRNKSTFNYNEKNLLKILQTQVTEIPTFKTWYHTTSPQVASNVIKTLINKVYLPHQATIKAAIQLQRTILLVIIQALGAE